ncbi:MAG TPA: hypothetical protein PK156_20430, partial [Polyangium sp.]|nr:hypothetical protein [Polyangium sp.]
MSASKSPFEPRPEAEVVAWKDLTQDQRDAVIGAHGLFSRMAELADETDKRDSSGDAVLDLFLPHIDEKRKNHVVLIDGERGTGKTAVMLRLLVDWVAAVRRQPRPDIHGTDGTQSPVNSDSPIVPVGLLDLQALSPKAMLGLHLVGSLQRVVEAMERRPAKAPRTAPWGPGESEDLASRKAWRKFLSAAAAAWDGNLKERQGKLDPEAYVIELEHAERERLEIGATFRAFVDALVVDYHHHFQPKKKPFFVITIDDADLNPQRTMEIFELIRVLWHPRVGFLIAGDGGLFVTVLEEDFKKLNIPIAQAEALARDSYRKAIPPTQRRRIGTKPHERYYKLELALQQIKSGALMFGSESTAMDYFRADPGLQDAFPRRIRNLIDVQNQLAADLASKTLSIGRLAYSLWNSSLEGADGVRELEEKNLVLHEPETDRITISGPIQFVGERRELDRKQINTQFRAIFYDLRKLVRPEKQYR